LLGVAVVIIDWDTALRVMREATGMPTLIGLELAPEGSGSVPGTETPADAPAAAPVRGAAP
jgi:hypothetical protein